MRLSILIALALSGVFLFLTSPSDTGGGGEVRPAVVIAAQARLAALGFDPGPVDGLPGRRTADAVRAYQRHAGEPETGVVTGRLLVIDQIAP